MVETELSTLYYRQDVCMGGIKGALGEEAGGGRKKGKKRESYRFDFSRIVWWRSSEGEEKKRGPQKKRKKGEAREKGRDMGTLSAITLMYSNISSRCRRPRDLKRGKREKKGKKKRRRGRRGRGEKEKGEGGDECRLLSLPFLL